MCINNDQLTRKVFLKSFNQFIFFISGVDFSLFWIQSTAHAREYCSESIILLPSNLQLIII